ncbi:hypothetical protein FB446DRAFT_704393 [Lentinula raphanica]|nr:hypothetical protein FB446DRAFT_704393 [Lentinula raphanica]
MPNPSGSPDSNPPNPEVSGLLGGGHHAGVFPLQLQQQPAQQVSFQPTPASNLPPPQNFYQPPPLPFHNSGFQQPLPPFQGMAPLPPPQMAIPLRITLGNIIAHSKGCAICTNYIAHMVMASTTDEFNEIMTLRDSRIRGAGSSSSSGSCNHEPIISSLQEQLSSLRGIRDLKRQTMSDRILALELERDEYRNRYHQEREQVDDLTRENGELNESRRYWKYRYGTPEREPDDSLPGPSLSGSRKALPATQETQSETSRSKSKPDRKGKGKEVLMVPLEQRIATGREAEPRESPIPLSQRMSPMREDTDPPAVIASTTASSDAGSVPRVEEGSGRTAEPYEGPYSSTPSGVTRLKLPELSDALGLPPPLKHGKRSKKREFDALRRTVSKEEFKSPSTPEEVDTINHALRESDSFQPPRLMWRTMNGMRRMYEHARAIPAVNRSELEKALVSRFNYIPRWYYEALAEQKKRPFVFPTMQAPQLTTNQPSAELIAPNDVAESSTTTGGPVSTGNSLAKPRQSLQTRLAEVRDQRSWEGLHEDHTIPEWADRIIHSTNSNHLPGMRVETVDYKFAANSRGIRGMLEVQRLLPNVLGLNDAASLEANIYIHLVLCELVFLPGAYERILAAPGISLHTTHRPGPLPMYAGPVGVEQIAYDLALRGYTPAHLSDLALYLMWWVQDIAHEIPNVGLAVQQQFVHVVRDVLVQHAHRGVPRSGPRFTEQYVFSDGSTRDNIEAAGWFAELQLIVEALRLKVDRISPQEAGVGEAGASNEPQPQPSTADIVADVPEMVDWDQVTHDENGDPILDYGDGDETGMDMAR